MKLEAVIAGGVALWDAQEDLPRAGQYPRRREPISSLLFHHSGALGPEGLLGMQVSANFVVHKRGWMEFAYHFWIPYRDERDAEGRMVIFRGNGDHERTNHTSGWNEPGIGVCLQGSLGKTGPTMSQIEIMEAFIPWWMDRHDCDPKDALTWHSEAGQKKSCPGGPTVAWLRAYRELSG